MGVLKLVFLGSSTVLLSTLAPTSPVEELCDGTGVEEDDEHEEMDSEGLMIEGRMGGASRQWSYSPGK
jgi:hypothetical protein